MKMRNGFVSNSSSSSFVILGVHYTNKEIDAKFGEDWDYYENDDFEKCEVISLDSDGYIIGVILADSEYLEDDEVELEDLISYKPLIIKDLGVEPKDIKLYFGTRPC